MNGLALQIVEWMLCAVGTGKSLRCFVGFKAHIALLVVVRLARLSPRPV